MQQHEPPSPEINSLEITGFPAEVVVWLWKNEPGSISQPSDMIFLVRFIKIVHRFCYLRRAHPLRLQSVMSNLYTFPSSLSKAAAPHIDYNQDMIHIDGSLGEGGARSCGPPWPWPYLPKNRFTSRIFAPTGANPGLRPQHLTAVEASAAISNARVQGAQVGASGSHF